MRPLRQFDFRKVGGVGIFRAEGDFLAGLDLYLAACASQYHFLSGSLSAR